MLHGELLDLTMSGQLNRSKSIRMALPTHATFTHSPFPLSAPYFMKSVPLPLLGGSAGLPLR